MGRSKPGPSFRIPAGERLTTTRRSGHASPELSTAGRTRSLASWTAGPGRPARTTAGSPRPTCASTVTSRPCTPTTATPNTRPYTAGSVEPPTDTPPSRCLDVGGRVGYLRPGLDAGAIDQLLDFMLYRVPCEGTGSPRWWSSPCVPRPRASLQPQPPPPRSSSSPRLLLPPARSIWSEGVRAIRDSGHLLRHTSRGDHHYRSLWVLHLSLQGAQGRHPGYSFGGGR